MNNTKPIRTLKHMALALGLVGLSMAISSCCKSWQSQPASNTTPATNTGYIVDDSGK